MSSTLALTRPSDDTITRRIAAYIRRPWGSAEGSVNLLTGRPSPAAAVAAWMNGEDLPPVACVVAVCEHGSMACPECDGVVDVDEPAPAEKPEPAAPSRTRPAAPADWKPTPRPATGVPRRRLVRRFADRLGQTIDLYRQRVRRHLAEGGAGSRRGSWEGQG